jgi:hypothetical protein
VFDVSLFFEYAAFSNILYCDQNSGIEKAEFLFRVFTERTLTFYCILKCSASSPNSVSVERALKHVSDTDFG